MELGTAAVVAGSDGDDTGGATHFRGDALPRHGDARVARLGGATTPRTTSLGERLREVANLGSTGGFASRPIRRANVGRAQTSSRVTRVEKKTENGG